MAVIIEKYLVTIEIDTEKAKPFPDGFKAPSTNNGDNGMNWNTYPNWDLNYQGRESTFIEMMWADFLSAFVFDGLECSVTRIQPQSFWSN
jgi:hypothetical protein